MMTLPELAADALEEFLGSYMRRRFGPSQILVEMVPAAARIALECIGNSDALYHNVEHTLLVTLAGHDILRGRALHNQVTAEDYAHVIIACLAHDIGYVRGLFTDDDEDGFVIDAAGGKVTLPRGSSDAGLMPHHVDRSKVRSVWLPSRRYTRPPLPEHSMKRITDRPGKRRRSSSVKISGRSTMPWISNE